MGSPHFIRAMIGLSGARLALRLTPTFEEQCRIPGVPCALAEILEMNRKTISKQVLCFIIEGSSFSFCAVSGAKQTNWNLDPGTAVAKRRKANRGKTCLVLRSERHYGRMQHCSHSKIPNQHQRNSWPPNGILHGCFLPKKLTHPSMGNRILKSFYAAQTGSSNRHGGHRSISRSITSRRPRKARRKSGNSNKSSRMSVPLIKKAGPGRNLSPSRF